ncbi:hypothetical protein M406DRAFT_333461 [Cryphonectria parasitica EP155]|uniref:Uncharacterized protein n=1 Tax=Cryphonectria parasitica (strain ATCC 38755 / EP155) TaxID=660469 RepID=A0A9P4XUT7_CRYP1|nr:uncharacterized protein M406DRAFT_333461 [Cryphonectria parasitica EP155]KAF3761398.1 hypothetical protein M406DRAFT_333461 [Cryphonectria parasitica EP155]
MSYGLNLSWEAPPVSLIQFTACQPVSAFVSYIYTGVASNASASPYATVPTETAIEFMQAIVPDNWTVPNEAEAMLWYMSLAEGDYDYNFTQASDFALESCNATICPYLNWDGDADLSGIGMMISYYMAAVFVTVYYIVLAPEVCHALGGPSLSLPWRKKYNKFVAGFEESIQGFLDAMLLFTISMLVAAITRYGSVIMNPDKTYSLFNLLDCVFLSTFSIFPGFVLQSLSHELRRRRIRLFLWFLVLVFAITVDVLYNMEFLSIFTDINHLEKFASKEIEKVQAIWLIDCQSLSLLNALQVVLKVGHVFMIFNCSWWVYYVVASLGGRNYRHVFERREKFWRVWELVRLWLRLGNGLLCLGIMWTFLGLFTVYRHDVSVKSGGTDGDNEWTFGQVLALVTWIPVGIDLSVVYIYGAKEGLAGKMSRKYKVITRSQQDLVKDGVKYEQSPTEDKDRINEHLFENNRWPKPLEKSESWLDA